MFKLVTWMCPCRSKTIDFKTFNKFLDELASAKKMDVSDLKSKLVECGLPGTSGATVSSKYSRPPEPGEPSAAVHAL